MEGSAVTNKPTITSSKLQHYEPTLAAPDMKTCPPTKEPHLMADTVIAATPFGGKNLSPTSPEPLGCINAGDQKKDSKWYTKNIKPM